MAFFADINCSIDLISDISSIRKVYSTFAEGQGDLAIK